MAWGQLHNPILSYPDASVKDQALVWANGKWRMFFSYIKPDVPTPGGEHWSIAWATSADLTHCSAPIVWSDQIGTLGVASPDLVRSPAGVYVATYESNPGDVAGQDKVYYRTSTDLVNWSPARDLAPSVAPAPGQRMIDPALAWTGNGLILGFKSGLRAGSQHFEIAWSPSGSLDGPWKLIGRPEIVVYGDTIENYQFVRTNGQWLLVATSNQFDQPWLFHLAGDPKNPSSWLHWRGNRELNVASEVWDSGAGISGATFEHANSGYLCDARSIDGSYYLVFSGAPEMTRFGGWGHDGIGVARSTDLVHWHVP